MIDASASNDFTTLDKVRDRALQSPTLMNNSLKIVRRRGLKRLREKTEQMPPQGDLPFVWSLDPEANLRARRWWYANYVAKQGRRSGGRYRRRGKNGGIITGWDIVLELSPRGGSITLKNDMPGAEHVYGPRKVPGHALWPNKDDIARDEAAWQLNEVHELWKTISDPYAAVPR
jgi:hypothetical protein